MNRAVQLEKAGRAMSMGYLQIVFAFVESAFIFGTPPFWWEYVGTLFVVSGSALMLCKPKKAVGSVDGGGAVELLPSEEAAALHEAQT
jgi:hypothetical protein